MEVVVLVRDGVEWKMKIRVEKEYVVEVQYSRCGWVDRRG